MVTIGVVYKVVQIMKHEYTGIILLVFPHFNNKIYDHCINIPHVIFKNVDMTWHDYLTTRYYMRSSMMYIIHIFNITQFTKNLFKYF